MTISGETKKLSTELGVDAQELQQHFDDVEARMGKLSECPRCHSNDSFELVSESPDIEMELETGTPHIKQVRVCRNCGFEETTTWEEGQEP